MQSSTSIKFTLFFCIVHIILTDLKEKQGFLISSLHILFSPLIAKSNIKFFRENVIYEEEEFWD